MWGRRTLALSAILLAALPAAALAGGRRGYPGPPPRHAPLGQLYLVARGGLFEPNDAGDGLSGYDSGWSFAGGIGSRVSPVLAVEGMVGSYGADRGRDEVRVMPITMGLRLIAPGPFLEPYLGAGVGLYFAELQEETFVSGGGTGQIDDSDTAVGGYLSLGLDAWMAPRLALNFEGGYQFAQASFQSEAGNSFDVDVGGWTVSVGLRLEL